MGFLSSLFGLGQSAKDDLDLADKIWRDARAAGRDLTKAEVKQVEKLMEMRQDKIDRARERGGLGW